MANPAQETVLAPFTAFNFAVEIYRQGQSDPLVTAAFSECDGLETTMDLKTIREGGNNGRQIRLTGPFSFGQITLKRGMTTNFDFWDWVRDTLEDPSLRADAEVVVMAADRRTKNVSFVLSRCIPVKLKAPPLNAKDGMVAIEELQLAYESLTLKRN